jgi:hypothetical protein
MPASPVYGFPYQSLSDPPNGASLGENGFLAVDTALAGVDTRVAALESAATLNARLQAVTTAGQTLAASSTTLQDITGLSLPVVAATYAWELVVPYESASNTPDIKIAMTFPSTSSASYNYMILTLSTAGGGPYALEMGGASAMSSGVEFMACGTVGLRATAQAYGHITFTAAGTLKVQAAQNTSNATVVTVHPGSQLRLNRV